MARSKYRMAWDVKPSIRDKFEHWITTDQCENILRGCFLAGMYFLMLYLTYLWFIGVL